MSDDDLIDQIARIAGDEKGLLRQAIDTELIGHLDFAQTCGVVRTAVIDLDVIREAPRCGKTAVWVAECRSCGHVAHLCDGCREESLRVRGTICKGCMAVGDPDLIFSYSPLGGAA